MRVQSPLHLAGAVVGVLASLVLPPSALAAETPAPPADPVASSSLEHALTALAIGDVQTGCTLLQPLAAPDSPERERAHELARAVNARDPRACTWVDGAVPGSAPAEARDGRVELMVSQGIAAPLWFATLLPVYAPERVDPGVTGAMLLLGLGAGIGVPYAITEHIEVTTGQALTVYTAEVLGGWYGLWLEGALGNEGLSGRPAHLGVLAGLGAGIGLASAFPDVSAGDVALVRSGALWGTAYGGVALAVFAHDPDRTRAFTVVGMGTTLGVAGTLALTHPLELRRGQVNLINLGGYAGLLTSGAFLLMLQPEGPRGAIATLGVGSAVGLGVGALLVTRSHGDGALSRLGLPAAGFSMLEDGSGRRHPGLVVQGRW